MARQALLFDILYFSILAVMVQGTEMTMGPKDTSSFAALFKSADSNLISVIQASYTIVLAIMIGVVLPIILYRIMDGAWPYQRRRGSLRPSEQEEEEEEEEEELELEPEQERVSLLQPTVAVEQYEPSLDLGLTAAQFGQVAESYASKWAHGHAALYFAKAASIYIGDADNERAIQMLKLSGEQYVLCANDHVSRGHLWLAAFNFEAAGKVFRAANYDLYAATSYGNAADTYTLVGDAEKARDANRLAFQLRTGLIADP